MKKRRAVVGLGIVLGLVVCGQGPAPQMQQAMAAPGSQAPPLLTAAFVKGAAVERHGVRVVFEPRLIGRLRLPSGRVVACDPFACERGRPFARPVPAGDFPLYLAIVRSEGEERVALAKIAFSDEPAVAWEMALTVAEDPVRATGGGVFGYGVDSGTGAFMDQQVWQEYEERLRREPQTFADRVHDRFQRNASGSVSWQVLPLRRGSVALFSSGHGDGGYASYWGYDRQGRLAALVTDFQVIDGDPLLGAP